MKKNFLLSLLASFLIISCTTETTAPPKPEISQRQLYLDAVAEVQQKTIAAQIDSVFAKTDFNGIVSVYKKEKLLYQRINGFQNFKSKTQLSANSTFAIGSVSKQFTAALILSQVDQGKLKTTDLVSQYLESFKRNAYKEISVHQLLNHTSGISDLGPGLQSKPGEEFHYSNKGFLYLGKLVEKVSGKSYDQNLKELLIKTGMKNSFTADHFKGNNLAGAYLGNLKNFSVVPNMPQRLAQESVSVAAGGILSTSDDMHKWNSALYAGQFFKAETLAKMLTQSSKTEHPILGSVGYGYGIMMNSKPKSYFHSGYVKGSPSLLIYYPDSKTSVVILSNIADMDKGKESVFIPHKSVKEIMDRSEANQQQLNLN